MRGRKTAWWLILALVALLGASCSGVLLESRQEDGREERLRIDGGESWSAYDRNSRKEDETCIMLKKESTF
jgi:hypothetical protein